VTWALVPSVANHEAGRAGLGLSQPAAGDQLDQLAAKKGARRALHHHDE